MRAGRLAETFEERVGEWWNPPSSTASVLIAVLYTYHRAPLKLGVAYLGSYPPSIRLKERLESKEDREKEGDWSIAFGLL